MRRIIPPGWLLISLIAMTGLHFYLPIARIVEVPWSYLGAVFIVIGIIVSATGAATFRRAGTPVKPFERSTMLVTHGIYRFTRNPMYLGLLLVQVGAAIAFGTLSPWFPIPAFFLIVRTQFVRGEEEFMEGIFGADYLAYKRRVRRWI